MATEKILSKEELKKYNDDWKKIKNTKCDIRNLKNGQKLVFCAIEYEDLTPSRAQSIKIRKLTEKKKLDF